jgi:hypothetical protein
MTISFAPRSVPPSRSFAWVKDGFDLVTRRWAFYTAMVLGPALLLPMLPALVVLLITPLVCAMLVATSLVVVSCTDDHSPIRPALWAARFAYLRLLAIVAFRQGVAMAIFAGASFMSHEAARMAAGAPAQASDFIGGSSLLVGLAIGWAMTYPDEFYLLALMFAAGANWTQATALSKAGHKVNGFTMWIHTAMVIIAFTAAALQGLIAILLVPLSGALLYCAYRDVFLGRTENNPAGARQASPAGVAQSAARG